MNTLNENLTTEIEWDTNYPAEKHHINFLKEVIVELKAENEALKLKLVGFMLRSEIK